MSLRDEKQLGIHTAEHPLAGQTVTLGAGALDPLRGIVVEGVDLTIEDWWDRVSGESWMTADGNFAALHYAMRNGATGLPLDDEVVYGHIGRYGHLVHVSEVQS